MEKGRFQLIFDRLSKSVVQTETMTATIRVERLSEVQEIEDRIDAEVWDRQIEADSAAGRLDALMDESMAEHEAGESRAL
jgi:hypothetical protein